MTHDTANTIKAYIDKRIESGNYYFMDTEILQGQGGYTLEVQSTNDRIAGLNFLIPICTCYGALCWVTIQDGHPVLKIF